LTSQTKRVEEGKRKKKDQRPKRLLAGERERERKRDCVVGCPVQFRGTNEQSCK
jgi:hypothetical protein